jgi:hypothetical protein
MAADAATSSEAMQILMTFREPRRSVVVSAQMPDNRGQMMDTSLDNDPIDRDPVRQCSRTVPLSIAKREARLDL